MHGIEAGYEADHGSSQCGKPSQQGRDLRRHGRLIGSRVGWRTCWRSGWQGVRRCHEFPPLLKSVRAARQELRRGVVNEGRGLVGRPNSRTQPPVSYLAPRCAEGRVCTCPRLQLARGVPLDFDTDSKVDLGGQAAARAVQRLPGRLPSGWPGPGAPSGRQRNAGAYQRSSTSRGRKRQPCWMMRRGAPGSAHPGTVCGHLPAAPHGPVPGRGQPGPVAEPRSRSMCRHHPQSPRRCRRSAARGSGRSARQTSSGSAMPPAGRTDPRGSGGGFGENEAALAAQPGAFFTVPHFDGYPAVLIQLKNVARAALREAIIDGWLGCAPTRLVDQYPGALSAAEAHVRCRSRSACSCRWPGHSAVPGHAEFVGRHAGVGCETALLTTVGPREPQHRSPAALVIAAA